MSDLASVSVIIPAFQAERTLARTLASAQSQTLRDIEIVLVNDGSTDGTAEIASAAAAADARVRVLNQANAGVAAARNLAISVARGRWIAPLDADDIWHPLKLERQLAATAARQAPGFVYSWSRGIDAEDRVLADHGRPRFRGDVLALFLASNFLYSASIPLLRREAVERAGGFDESLQARGAHGGEDLGLWLAIAETERAELAPGFLVGYRMTPDSMSRAGTRMHRSLNLVLDGFAARRADTPSALLRLGRLNADMYAAALALSGGRRLDAIRWIGKGLRRDPAEAVRFLACQAALRSTRAVPRGGPRPRFLEMSPDQPFRTSDGPWLDGLRETAARRAAGTWRTAELRDGAVDDHTSGVPTAEESMAPRSIR